MPDACVHACARVCVLQAQRLAAIDALLRNGAGAGSGAGAASGDLETKLRRLSADVRLLKDRLGELGAAAAAGGGQVRPAGPEGLYIIGCHYSLAWASQSG